MENENTFLIILTNGFMINIGYNDGCYYLFVLCGAYLILKGIVHSAAKGSIRGLCLGRLPTLSTRTL